MIDSISALIIPIILCIASLFLFFDKKNCFGAFVEGAKEGLSVSISLIPTMVLIMTALSMLSASGAIEFTVSSAGDSFRKLGIPTETLPLILTRPFSGSGANASFIQLLQDAGADSFPAFAASVIMGSGDTLVYIVSVYFSGAKNVKNTAYTLPVSIAAMIFSVFFCLFLARLFY